MQFVALKSIKFNWNITWISSMPIFNYRNQWGCYKGGSGGNCPRKNQGFIIERGQKGRFCPPAKIGQKYVLPSQSQTHNSLSDRNASTKKWYTILRHSIFLCPSDIWNEIVLLYKTTNFIFHFYYCRLYCSWKLFMCITVPSMFECLYLWCSSNFQLI